MSSLKNKKSWETKKKGFTFIDLFAGIGGFRIGLEQNGGECVFSSEWDKNSQLTYATNFGSYPEGDITKINEKKVPKHNILCGGFPCQAFSVSGNRKGFEDTRGTLFFDVARIVKQTKPDVVFLENVKGFAKHDDGKTLIKITDTLKEIGYTVFHKILKSSDYGVPQARERIYIVAFHKRTKVKNFEYPEPIKETVVVKDILEKGKPKLAKIIERDDVVFSKKDTKEKHRKPYKIGIINKGGQGERIYSVNSAGITLSAYGGGVAGKTGAYLVGKTIRKLSPRECARMQGFPEDFEIPVSVNLSQKQFGDSVSVPVIRLIAKNILTALNKNKDEK